MRPSFPYHPSCSSLYLSLDMFFFLFSPFCLFVSPVSFTFLRVILFLTESRHLTSGGKEKKNVLPKSVVCVHMCVCKTVILRQIKERLVTLMTAELQRERRKSLKDSD